MVDRGAAANGKPIRAVDRFQAYSPGSLAMLPRQAKGRDAWAGFLSAISSIDIKLITPLVQIGHLKNRDRFLLIAIGRSCLSRAKIRITMRIRRKRS
jgi:hypothetical protein